MSTNFENLVLRNTAANRPAAGKPGRLFFDTTNNKLQRDNGSTWDDVESTTSGGVARSGSTTDGHLAVWNGSSADSIKDGGVAPANYEPWRADILPTLSDPSATTGTWAVGHWENESGLGPFVYNGGSTVGAVGFQNTSAAQNDAVSWDVTLSPGTWNAAIWVRKSTNTGIITLLLDGVSMGTVDTYNGSVAYAKVTITGFTVTVTGHQTLQIKMATKNGSSSGYVVAMFGISLRRTA